MTDIEIHNLYDNVAYLFQDNILYISWDKTNKTINSFMIDELNPYAHVGDTAPLYSCMWVDELKKRISWEMDTRIHIKIQYTKPGEFCVIVSNKEMPGFVYEEIREDGYLYTAPFGEEFLPVLQRCDCIYNDLLKQESEHYILK